MRRQLSVCVIVCAAAMTGIAQAPPQWGVEPLWPQPLPNHWILGSVTGVAVDANDRVWVAHRGLASLLTRTENGLDATPKGAEYCCAAAPQILAFEADGRLAANWGGPGPGYDWPRNLGGIAVDATGHVWITAQGLPPAPPPRGGAAAVTTPPPPEDAHVLKFTRDGKFVLQIGKAGAPGDATSKVGLLKPAAIDVDSAANEAYVADTGNHRIVVFDATTGAYKRHWAAAGATPFNTVTCVSVSRAGEVYVCDRDNNRIQVFKTDGAFVREAVVSASTKGAGSVWDIGFSNDAAQQHVFVANGTEQTVHVLRRDTLAEIGRIGTGGRWPGHFFGVASVAVDSKGNVVTGEALQGKRVQKFVVR
jgi:DNA-binding beta-propeller fold protein YncE